MGFVRIYNQPCLFRKPGRRRGRWHLSLPYRAGPLQSPVTSPTLPRNVGGVVYVRSRDGALRPSQMGCGRHAVCMCDQMVKMTAGKLISRTSYFICKNLFNTWYVCTPVGLGIYCSRISYIVSNFRCVISVEKNDIITNIGISIYHKY